MSRLRAFLLWAVMLAVPLQGYAAASMVFCATGHPEGIALTETAQAASHDHTKHQHASPNQDDSHDHDSASLDTDAAHKCGTCGACHALALTTTPHVTAPHQLPEADLAEPFSAMATISPRVLDKPPRA